MVLIQRQSSKLNKSTINRFRQLLCVIFPQKIVNLFLITINLIFLSNFIEQNKLNKNVFHFVNKKYTCKLAI